MKRLYYTADNGDSGSCDYDRIIAEKLQRNPSILEIAICNYTSDIPIDTDILPDGSIQSLPDWIDKLMVILALLNFKWSQKNAAKSLGISQRVMNYKIYKYGINHYGWRKNSKEK